MPCIHTFSVLRFCPPHVRAHLSVIPALCPAGGGFVAALGLVALTLKGCCLQRLVYYSSRVHSAACFAATTSFLGSF